MNTAIGYEALYNNTTGENNTATGGDALAGNTTGNDNTANGVVALESNTTGSNNTANGYQALADNTTGNDNTANGMNALISNTIGGSNTANGVQALSSNTTGNDNTALGAVALYNNTTGGGNTALGLGAGSNVTTADNVICIGAGVAGANVSGTTYIDGIWGPNVGANGLPVYVNANGQLGTNATSSRRFKKDIADMNSTSDVLLCLRPVTFHYKPEIEPKGSPQWGLIAEEVAKVNPDLVVRDAQGEIYSVRYDAINVMLLNEFLKEHSKVEKLEATVAKQHKDFEAALADLKGQIQKVSAQLEMNKSAPQTVLNNH
jgi:hypothetical protein